MHHNPFPMCSPIPPNTKRPLPRGSVALTMLAFQDNKSSQHLVSSPTLTNYIPSFAPFSALTWVSGLAPSRDGITQEKPKKDRHEKRPSPMRGT